MSIQEFLDTPATRLEDLTGIKQVQWSHYFNGRRSPSLRTISEIAGKLEMTPGDLSEAILERMMMHPLC